MDIYEDWAMHMDEIGTSFIAGSQGGLKFLDVDTTGGPLAVPEGGSIVGGGALQNPRLEWFGVDENGVLFDNKIDCAIGDITGMQELMLNPEISSELERTVTADEIKAIAKSIALLQQQTPFGTIKYHFDEYKPE